MRSLAVLALLSAAVLAQQRRPATAKPKPAPAPAKSLPVPAPATPQVFRIETMAVEGNKQFPSDRILAASGLKLGDEGNTTVFDAARDRLVATGGFVTVGYRYAPGPSGKAYALTFEVHEADQFLPMRFDRLKITDAAARERLAKMPLFGDRIPPVAPVLERYRAAVEEAAGEPVKVRVVTETPGQLEISFHPAALPPVVAEVHFKGNQVITEKALQLAISGTAIGSEWREDRFQEVLRLGVVPLYEQRGRVRVKFPKLEATPATGGVKGLAVTVTVEEGESYTIGEVIVEGTETLNQQLAKTVELKGGDVANFDQVKAGQEKLQQAMRRNGYMKVASLIDRKIDDKTKTVAIVYRLTPGPQYRFGKMTVQGLDINGAAAIKKMWGMDAGKVFNVEYPDYFLNRVKEEGVFDDLHETRSQVKLDEAAEIANVTLIFAGKPVRKTTDRLGNPIPASPGNPII